MQATEVTQAQWKALMGENPSSVPAVSEVHPTTDSGILVFVFAGCLEWVYDSNQEGW